VIVISQLYGGGGNSGAPYQNDFIELYNRGTTTIDIGGWSLQYTSAAGISWGNQKLALGGTIAPGQYYLIALSSGGATGNPLPTPSIRPAIQLGEVSVDCRGLDLNFAQPSCCQAEPFQSAECGHIRS